MVVNKNLLVYLLLGVEDSCQHWTWSPLGLKATSVPVNKTGQSLLFDTGDIHSVSTLISIQTTTSEWYLFPTIPWLGRRCSLPKMQFGSSQSYARDSANTAMLGTTAHGHTLSPQNTTKLATHLLIQA